MPEGVGPREGGNDRSLEKAARRNVKEDQRRSKEARRTREKEKKEKGAKRDRTKPPRTVHENFAALVTSCRRALVPVTEPVVLICQAQRSGGTLLRNLFDGHPQCHVHPGEWHIGHTRRYLWPKLKPDQPPETWWVRLREEVLERRFQTGIPVDPSKYRGEDASRREGTYPFLLPPLLHRALFLGAIADIRKYREIEGDRDILNAYLTGLFNAWLDNHTLRSSEKRWAVAFAPRLAWDERREQFFEAYPDGRLISILRDPYSWMASARGRQIKDAENSERLLTLWTKSTREMIAAKRDRADQVTVLRFEDLVRSPDDVMRGLADALGIDFADSMVEPTFNSRPIGANSSFAFATEGVVVDPLKSHGNRFDEHQRRLISEACDELYQTASDVAQASVSA